MESIFHGEAEITMTANDFTSIVHYKLSASESEVQAWKVDHEQAMRVFDWQDLIAGVIELYHDIDRLNKSIVDDIVDGLIEYDEERDDKIKGLCSRWITLAVNACDGLSAPWFKNSGHTIDNEAELVKCIKMAQNSQMHNFDDYSNEKISGLSIPRGLVNKFQTPMHQWPE